MAAEVLGLANLPRRRKAESPDKECSCGASLSLCFRPGRRMSNEGARLSMCTEVMEVELVELVQICYSSFGLLASSGPLTLAQLLEQGQMRSCAARYSRTK
jgi:hypothetical protein